jgi:8-oxo-dGTP pyrophosphatase MutT (NUDIX family)
MQPDVCLTVVLDEADNFLVIRRSKRNTRAGQWEPPLGHRDSGESPSAAALREVAEETGLSVQLLGGTTNKRSGDGKRIRLFLARASGTKPDVKTEPSEHDEHKWLTLAQMNALEDCHDTLKKDISELLKANKQTKEANMLPAMQPGMGLPLAPRFSGSYQPRLAGKPNPLASVKAPAVAKADTSGIQEALAKVGSMCLSATGEGKHKYKINPEDTANGEKAFESLDRFKRAGLNNFQASFFGRMVAAGQSATQIKQAIDLAERKFGKKIASELKVGFDKLSGFGTPRLPGNTGPADFEQAFSLSQPSNKPNKPMLTGYPPLGGMISAGRSSAPNLLNAGKNLGQKYAPGLFGASQKAAPAVRSVSTGIQNAAPKAAPSLAPAAAKKWLPSWVGGAANTIGSTAVGMGLGGHLMQAGMPTTDDMINKMVEHPKLAPLLQLGEKMNSGGGGFDLPGMFEQNKSWLIPLIASMGLGAAGGGMLGGGGGAFGGAIGLPLIYYLMQNPDALSQFTGRAPTAAKPPVAPTQPPKNWHPPMMPPPAQGV